MPLAQGHLKLDVVTGRFPRVTYMNNSILLPDANISKVLEDKNGNCWITDYTGGLFKYNHKRQHRGRILLLHTAYQMNM